MAVVARYNDVATHAVIVVAISTHFFGSAMGVPPDSVCRMLKLYAFNDITGKMVSDINLLKK